jgi:outer membrane protein assembly factor BamB
VKDPEPISGDLRRVRWLVILCVAGCSSPPPSRPRPSSPTTTTTPSAHTCALHGAVAAGPAGAAWQVELGRGTGGLVLGTSGELVVAGRQGGMTVSIDVATGAVCAELVAPPRAGRASPIDPYTERSAIAHELLIGPSKQTIAAVDLWTGAERWHRDVATGDDYALRDALQIVSTSAAIVAGYPTRGRAGDSFHHRELASALDPETGRELWRATIVDHRPGEPMQLQGTMRLAADDARVFARTPGKLVALDGATGAVMWTFAWTPIQLSVGSPTPAKKAPLIAANGTHVALAFPDHVLVFDARTGARVAELAVTGAATELAPSRDGFVVALVAEPGVASVVAIDASRARWSYTAAYSVARIRVDGDLVYVLDGNGRIWGLALADGAVRFGLGQQVYDFAVARGRIIAPTGPLVAYDLPHGMPPPLAPFLRWQFDPTTCRTRALAWVDGDNRVVWERAVPARVVAAARGSCEQLELGYYRRRPRASADGRFLSFGIHEAETVLVQADVSGLFVLRKTDGAVLLDLDAPDDHGLFFDDGEFELRGLAGCSGRSSYAHVLARCGERIVYFNGRTALVVALDTLRVEARGRFDGMVDAVHGRRAETSEAEIAVGAWTLVLRGITYMR